MKTLCVLCASVVNPGLLKTALMILTSAVKKVKNDSEISPPRRGGPGGGESLKSKISVCSMPLW